MFRDVYIKAQGDSRLLAFKLGSYKLDIESIIPKLVLAAI